MGYVLYAEFMLLMFIYLKKKTGTYRQSKQTDKKQKMKIEHITITSVLVVLLLWLMGRFSEVNTAKFKKRSLLKTYPFKAGDILCFYGGSRLTQLFGQSPCNHIGIVFQQPSTGFFYVFEMRMPPVSVATVFLKPGRNRGTRLTPLYRCLERWKHGPISVRSLLGEPLDLVKFQTFIQSRWHHDFALDYIARGSNRFFDVLFHIPVNPRTKSGPRYCAELVSETLEHLGVLDFTKSDKSPHSMIPRDFVEKTDSLPLVNTYSYTGEVLLDCKLPTKLH